MSRHVLILGGHGKIAQLLTPLLLRKAWTVTSIIRTQEQVATIEGLAPSDAKGKLHVLVRSIEEVKSEKAARAILDEVRPDSVVWSAGAGGKGGAERTFAIDRDAASHFVAASASTPSITHFILISYLGSRRAQPTWWSDAEWESGKPDQTGGMANYYAAKVAADEALYRAGQQRGKDFAAISLRPGTLTLDPPGKVELGTTTKSRGKVSRATVAAVTSELLSADGAKSAWIDLLSGDEEVGDAVRRVVRDGVDTVEGEPVTKGGSGLSKT